MVTVEQALLLHGLGFSIVPVPLPRADVPSGQPGDGKVPSMPWKPYQTTRASGALIRDWFRTPHNVAIVTGAVSNLVVVDADSDEALAWATEHLPYTARQVKTPDVHAEGAAERWIFDRTPEQALARYTSADDGTDRAFVRVLEQRHAAKVLDLSASKDPLAVAKAYRDVIETRQAARVRPEDLAALGTLDKLAADLGRSAAALAKPGEGGAARVLAVAGRPGSQPRPARATTPGTLDGRTA